MRPRTKALVAAGSGIAVGLGGLALTALPAGADDDPVLPTIDAEQLVTSALEATPPAFDGVAEVSNELGLPAVPGADALDFESVRVFHDGAESARVQVERPTSELTFVKNADEAWAYDSQENSARHLTWDDADLAAAREHAEAQAAQHAEARGHAEARMADPSQAATELIEHLRPTSDIVVDGTARVADRAAYELVLTPKPSEKTLLREVTVAIDEQTRVPLRFDVYANGRSEPVLSLGFTEFQVGAQDAGLFEFTPPAGADVETTDAGDVAQAHGEHAGQAGKPGGPEKLTTVGDGWDAVLVGTVPADALGRDLAGSGADGGAAGSEGFLGGAGSAGGEQDVAGLLAQIGRPVSGEFGSGSYVRIAVGGAIVTDDGQFAAGAVPRQVLVDALDQQ
ncbi:outer membrane lipoprotein carrier protein LolA [Promicromonospora sp. NPDC019610]|uniref:outer membrane lipoprotein carrier protein LolA n=1 Tax=Promicromonospora sp. NPDC019610 TaxID=3364405 RepID=UPI0037958E7E